MKYKEIQKLNKQERDKKLSELKIELIKAGSGKQDSKAKQIRKIIARIHTLNTAMEKKQ
jgi:ribosomal protein L29